MKRMISLTGVVLSDDAHLGEILKTAFRHLSIEGNVLQDTANARRAAQRLDLDCIVIDWRLRPDASTVMQSIRESPNSTCLTAAIISSAEELREAFAAGVSLAMYPPQTSDQVIRSLRPVYGSMIRHRRYSMRHSLRVPVSISADERTFEGNSIDLSMGGMALQSTCPLEVDQRIAVTFVVPGPESGLVKLYGIVRWVTAEGFAAGLQFRVVPPKQRSIFESWLDGELEDGRPGAGDLLSRVTLMSAQQ